MYTSELTWRGEGTKRKGKDYLLATNWIPRVTTGAFWLPPPGHLMAESKLTPVKPLLNCCQVEFTQPPMAHPMGDNCTHAISDFSCVLSHSSPLWVITFYGVMQRGCPSLLIESSLAEGEQLSYTMYLQAMSHSLCFYGIRDGGEMSDFSCGLSHSSSPRVKVDRGGFAFSAQLSAWLNPCFVFNHFIFFAVPEPELMTATPTI